MSVRGLAVLVLSFVGMIDTLFLSLTRNAGPVPCHITEGCGDVLGSVYSEVGGIPLSWFGLVFYLTAFGASVFALSGQARVLSWLRWPATGAFAVSLVLTGIQAFVLESYCEYCLTSAALSTGIFLMVWTAPRG